MTFHISQRIYRIEAATNNSPGTVIALDEDQVQIAYDEGGTGWWPADCLGVLQRPDAESVGQEWTDQNGVLWRVVQVRDEDGRFQSDYPETPERESLRWVIVEP